MHPSVNQYRVDSQVQEDLTDNGAANRPSKRRLEEDCDLARYDELEDEEEMGDVGCEDI
jgi:hypothetical protein